VCVCVCVCVCACACVYVVVFVFVCESISMCRQREPYCVTLSVKQALSRF
jgi:hypothetical protein